MISPCYWTSERKVCWASREISATEWYAGVTLG